MDGLIMKMLNMSISASWLILAVVIVRYILRKSPKWIRLVLWGIVAFRLICPLSLESKFSLVPSATTFGLYADTPTVKSGISVVDGTLNPMIHNTVTAHGVSNTQSAYIGFSIAGIIWLIGVVFMLCYAAASVFRLKSKLHEAVNLFDNVWICDKLQSPFVYGLIKPWIYLSSSMDQSQMKYVIAHERAHIKGKDPLWKLVGYVLLSVYWFNPFVWAAYVLFCRDVELACDERTIHQYGIEERKAYSRALLSCSMRRTVIITYPLAFGEIGVKERVKTVLNYKKPAIWIIAAALTVCVVMAICFLTNPVSAQSEATEAFSSSTNTNESGMGSNDIESYINEYEPFGVMFDNGILKYNGKRVRYFLDGYEWNDGQGAISTSSRYQYYDDDGIVDIHTVRDDVKNSDGSTTLFGSIVDIVPYSQEEFDSREYDSNDSMEAITDEGGEHPDRMEDISIERNAQNESPISKTENDEISVAMGNGGSGGATIAEMMKQYERFGITYEAIDGGKGNIYYNGSLIESFCDEKPDDSVLVIHSTNQGKGKAFTVYDNNVITGIELREENPMVNIPDAYAKLVAYKMDGYSQMSISEFNSSLLPELGELLEANAQVNVSPNDENYDFINVTLRASLSELYAEQMNEDAFFSGYVKNGRLSTPLNESEKAIFETEGPIYDFLFMATYYLEYEIISPDTVTIAERDNVLRSFGVDLQTYVDSLSEAELSGITEKELTDRALTILQENTPEGMTVSCEIQIDR